MLGHLSSLQVFPLEILKKFIQFGKQQNRPLQAQHASVAETCAGTQKLLSVRFDLKCFDQMSSYHHHRKMIASSSYQHYLCINIIVSSTSSYHQHYHHQHHWHSHHHYMTLQLFIDVDCKNVTYSSTVSDQVKAATETFLNPFFVKFLKTRFLDFIT